MENVETIITEDFYKLGLYLNDQPIMERIFDANVYNPEVRKGVEIRHMARDLIKMFQNTLQNEKPTFLNGINGKSVIENYERLHELDAKGYDDKLTRLSYGRMVEDSKKGIKYYENKKEQFKYVLFLNDFHIIERNFVVFNYNPDSRFSIELEETFNEVIDMIKEDIKKKDCDFLWKEYEKNPYHYDNVFS